MLVLYFLNCDLGDIKLLLHYRGFSKLPEVAIIGIFVLLKYENELLVTSDINLIQ